MEDRLVLKKEPSPIEINFKRRKSGGIRRRLILSVSVPALWIHHRAELTGWQEKRTDLHSCKPFSFSKNLVHASSHESRDFPALFLRFNYPSNQISLEESSIIDLITTWFRTMIKFSKTLSVISPRFKFEFSLQRNGQCCQIAGKSGGDYESRKRKLDDSKSGLWLDGSVVLDENSTRDYWSTVGGHRAVQEPSKSKKERERERKGDAMDRQTDAAPSPASNWFTWQRLSYRIRVAAQHDRCFKLDAFVERQSHYN